MGEKSKNQSMWSINQISKKSLQFQTVNAGIVRIMMNEIRKLVLNLLC
jgi:hypothetical protein